MSSVLEKVNMVFPGGSTKKYLFTYTEAMAYAGLDTMERKALFWANAGHETGMMKRFIENLNYSASGLAKTWPARYALRDSDSKVKVPSNLAKQIAHKPEMIANFTYSNRMGNGDYNSGDGWKYRGRGIFQITGRGNYQEADDFLHMDGALMENPDLMLTPRPSIMSAARFWKTRGLNDIADNINDVDEKISASRKKINGGLNGVAQVKDFYLRLIYMEI